MIEELRALQSGLAQLKSMLPKPQATRVSAKSIKEKTQGIVDQYFRSIRATLYGGGVSNTELEGLDSALQTMLEFTHKRSSAQNYSGEIKKAKTNIINLEQTCLIKGLGASIEDVQLELIDRKIIATLLKLVPSAAHSYQQAIEDLKSTERLSWRGPATDLRESLRETLDYLAPDDDVISKTGYKQEAGTTGPTMKQKVRYILSLREIAKVASATVEDSVSTVDALLGGFVRSVYTRSSVSTHTATDKNEVIRVRNLVRVALSELLQIQE